MALLLNLETATPVCSVAITSGGHLVTSRELRTGKAHASHLTILIDECLQESGIGWAQLDAIAVSLGPGSYTGLRIGLATAKGLCYALDKPLLGVGTLEAMAAGWYFQHPEQVDVMACPMIDARRMEVYTAIYDHERHEQLPVQAMVVDDQSFSGMLALERICFFGDGMAKCRPLLERHSNAFFDPSAGASAMGVGICAEQRFAAGAFEELVSAVPFYLKEFRTTAPRKNVS